MIRLILIMQKEEFLILKNKKLKMIYIIKNILKNVKLIGMLLKKIIQI